MTITAVALAAAAATSAPAETLQHRVTIAHRGTDIAAIYRADVAIATDQRGIAPPSHPSSERCHWTATIAIERTLAGVTTSPARAIATDTALNGSQPGSCRTQASAIEREVAARAPAIRERLIAAAEADRRALVAELEAIAPNG